MQGPKLSDDWRHDEPLAYVVKNYYTSTSDYCVFTNEGDAWRHASDQAEAAASDGAPDDWLIYPLYAGEAMDNTPRPKEPDHA